MATTAPSSQKLIEGRNYALNQYNEKNEHLRSLFEEVSPRDFYREIFPVGSFEEARDQDDQKPNGIAVDLSDPEKTKSWIVTDDHRAFEDLRQSKFAITSPISYFGKRRAGRNARWLYAMTFDIDGVGIKQLKDLLFQMQNDVIPTATYICNSGNGVHLYYVFESPIPMYPQNQVYLKELKYALTRQLWNRYTSTIDVPQMQGILQGFRVVGSQSKFGEGYPVRAFRIGNGTRHTVEGLLNYLPTARLEELKLLEKQSRMPLEEAKKKYPEWYERRIENGERRGRWNLNRAVYDYWLARLKGKEITVGHRYFAIMTLAIYAKKCSGYDPKKNPNPVTEEELRRDAYSLLAPFDELSVDNGNRFDSQDLEDALELYNEDYITFPKDDISKLTAIPIVPKIRRRDRPMKQSDHLEEARAIRDIRQRRKGGKWTDGNGRPKGSGTAEQTVKAWRAAHPEGKKAECIRDTGLSKPTVYRWWETK